MKTSATSGTDARVAISDPAAFGRVAVLLGGASSEREVSLETGAAVLAALVASGIDAEGWDPAGRSLQEFAVLGFDRVWIALHGPGGEDGALQGALEWLQLPYTGSGVLASALAMDKIRSKHLFRAAGLPTPAYRVIEGLADARRAQEALGLPLIVKPPGQGSSVGMSKVTDPAELGAAVDAALAFGDQVLVEQCIVGKEFTVGVLQGMALPTIRIETPRVFYDYEAKYHSDETRYHCPGTSSADEEARYAALAMAAFRELGCAGWGRVDFMTGADGTPQILEVNTVPGMTSHSLVPMAARAMGLDFAELCWRILETSLAAETGAAVHARREAANGT